MTTQKLEWQKERCPICGEQYSYLIAFKPATCGKFSCVQAYLHPEIKRSKNKEENNGNKAKA
jgi:hypothetical protein